MSLEFRILTGSTTPIFRQIVDQVRFAAATGRLAEGDTLPSIRALAERLLVNPNTIAKAYAQLTREGVVESRQGKGVVIAPSRAIYTASERQRRLTPALRALISEALALGFACEQVQTLLEREFRKISAEGRQHHE